MTGAVIITHGNLADALCKTAESITGHAEGVKVVPVDKSDNTDEIRAVLATAVDDVDSGEGVIIFTDMFGGTPSNIALSLLNDGSVEVITGVNLPLLIKFFCNRSDSSLGELADMLKEYGRESIVLAGDILKEKSTDDAAETHSESGIKSSSEN
ncbi:MAG: PTS sugar transporter subunit IIA [Proteobacteria bacterium]|nr:PTS sugar transporter subunit IIA [Pseudomonadota bacterium]